MGENEEEAEANKEDKKTSTLHKKSDSKKGKDKKKEKKDTQIRRTLTVIENKGLISPPVHTTDMVQLSRGRLQALEDADEARRQREAALNDLEGYIYKVKGRINEEEDMLAKVSTEAQRQAVLDLGTELEDWLYEAEAKEADVSVFKSKHKELRKLAEPIFDRHVESTKRPEAVETARKTIATVRSKMAEWPEKRPWVNETEIAKVEGLLSVAEKWLDEKEVEQSTIEPSEEAVFRSEDVPKQLSVVAREFEKLLKKPKPAPPKVDKANSTTSADTNGTASANTTANATASANATAGTGNSTEPEVVNVNVEGDAAADKMASSDATDGEL